jgi:hypothetical protein
MKGINIMGISRNTMDLIEAAKDILGIDFKDLKICEFGAQELRRSGFAIDHPVNTQKMCIAKQYFELLGAEHVSLDINEKYGSIHVDLSMPIDPADKWYRYFDILTDFGTIEHIKNAQYQSFKNAHNLVRNDGIMIHCLPMVGRIQRFHRPSICAYYEKDFFEKLARANNYEMIFETVFNNKPRCGGGNLTVSMRKQGNEFMTEEEFYKMGGIQ